MTQINWEFTDNARVGGYIVTATNWNDLAGSLRSFIDQTTSSASDATPLPIGIDLLNDRVYISDPDTTTPEAANHAATVLSVVGATTLAGNLTWDSTTLSNLITSAEAFVKDDVSLATGLAISNYIASVASPAGSDGYIQYKNGSVFGGEAELFWDDTNNRLGVGTATPANTLHVKKDVDDFVAKIENDGNSTSSDGLWLDTRWNTATNTVLKVTSNSGASDFFYIKGDGNVGIGTAAPASLLHVEEGNSGVTPSASHHVVLESDGDMGVLIASGSSSNGYLRFGDSGSASSGGFNYDHNGNSLKIRTAGTDWVTLNASGNLLVDPGHVKAQMSGADGGIVLGQCFSTSYSGLRTAGMSESGSEYIIMSNGTNTFVSAGSGGSLYLRGPANDSNPQIRIQSTLITLTGIVYVTDEIRLANGTAADPSLTFDSDGNTGFYRSASDQWGLSGGSNLNAYGTNTTTIGTAGTSTSSGSGYQYVFRNNSYGTLYRYTSRRDMKEQITPLADPGSIVDALSPVTFVPSFNPTVEGETETLDQQQLREVDLNYGFIADEVAEVADGKLAQWEWQDDGTLIPVGWKWPDIISVLTAEVKSLRTRIAQLEAT